MTDMIEVEPCGCCLNWVASFGRWTVEDPCPLQAVARVLELALEETAA